MAKRNPKINGYSNRVRLETKARKREENDARVAKWQALTPQQQLAELDKAGLTATKQRARIMKSLA